MTVTQHGGTSRALMVLAFTLGDTANGMPFATVIMCATVVRVAPILVAVHPTWVGYSVSDRERSCCSGSGVKRECRDLL
jgi:hypothetical protein